MSKATNIPIVWIEKNDYAALEKVQGAAFYAEMRGEEPDTHLLVSCPCGCGKAVTMFTKASPRLNPHQTWLNSGTRDKPTLMPSLKIYPNSADIEKGDVEPDGSHWHGFLTDGVWVSV